MEEEEERLGGDEWLLSLPVVYCNNYATHENPQYG